MFKLIFFSVCIGTMLWCATTALAQNGATLQLYEVFTCNGAGEKEWITLKNTSSAAISVANWILTDELGSASNTYYLNVTMNPGKIIYVEIPISRGIYNADTDIIYLKQNGTVIDSFTYGKDTTTKSCDQMPNSWQRTGSTWVQTDSKQTYVPSDELLTVTLTSDPVSIATASPTLAPISSPTLTPTPSATAALLQPTGISLVEVYACQQDDEDEWVELYNNTDSQIQLLNWEIKDNDNNTQSIKELIIPAMSYKAVDITKYGSGMLTNTGDTVRLFNGNKEKVDEYTYASSCKKGSAFAKIGNEWNETLTPTKSSANTLTTPTPSSIPTANPTSTATSTPSTTEQPTTSPTPESTSSGQLLETETQVLGVIAISNDLGESESPATTSAKPNLVPAAVAIGSGAVLFSGSMVYFGLDWFTKLHGKLPFPFPFLK